MADFDIYIQFDYHDNILKTDEKLTKEQVFQFVIPFCRLVTKSSNKVLASYTLKTILTSLLKRDPLEIDNGKLGDYLFKLAAKRSCQNRSLIYKFVNRCRTSSVKSATDEINMDTAESEISTNSNANGHAIDNSEEETSQLENSSKLIVKSKKRKNQVEEQDIVQDTVLVEKEKKKAKRRKLEVSGSPIEEDRKPVLPESNLLNEEIEIWVPNRKYKGPLAKQSPESAVKANKKNSTAKSATDSEPFMKFVKLDKLPAALVKKAFHTPKTEPRPTVFKISDTQGAFSTGQRKKVKFAKVLTQSQNFEDSLNLTPKPAFDPNIQPDRAILKASATKSVSVVSRIPKKQLFNNKQKRSPSFV